MSVNQVRSSTDESEHDCQGRRLETAAVQESSPTDANLRSSSSLSTFSSTGHMIVCGAEARARKVSARISSRQWLVEMKLPRHHLSRLATPFVSWLTIHHDNHNLCLSSRRARLGRTQVSAKSLYDPAPLGLSASSPYSLRRRPVVIKDLWARLQGGSLSVHTPVCHR